MLFTVGRLRGSYFGEKLVGACSSVAVFVQQVTFASQPLVEEGCLDVVGSLLEVARIYSLLHGQVKFAVVLVVFVVVVAVQL